MRKAYTVEDFPYDLMQYVPATKHANGHPKSHRKRYADIICTFDIESTNIDELKEAVMWHWQTCVDGLVCVGRTWDEYKLFLHGLDEQLPEDLCLVFYVHNLGYEFQFLRAVHDFTEEEVFCLSGRKVVKCEIGKRFEYRCSYCLTNMSLRELLKKHGLAGAEAPGDIEWNFTKFLIDRDGNIVKRFHPTTKPEEIDAILAPMF